MDPLTQGTLGAALPQSVARKQNIGIAMLCGLLAGMAPDLDVFIRSSEDPLLFLEYHRQFTHSLFFIPIGAGLIALILHTLWFKRRGHRFREIFVFCLLGYATHALLDACTTYGTQLLWPFSEQRFAWNAVSIIDPLLTLPLLLLVVLSRIHRQPILARLGFLWVVAYLALGVVMRDQAEQAGHQLAQSRGHQPTTLEAKPSFANILLWKIVYRHQQYYFVDAIRLGGKPKVYPGESVAALDIERDLPWLDHRSQQAVDIERFRWFSNGYVALDPNHPYRVMDLRYSLLPNEISPLWSIELDPGAAQDTHVGYQVDRGQRADTFTTFWRMLRGD